MANFKLFVILGKDVRFGSHLVYETETRVDDTIEKNDCILGEVDSRDDADVRLTRLLGMRSIIGILMYICITKPDLRGFGPYGRLLQSIHTPGS